MIREINKMPPDDEINESEESLLYILQEKLQQYLLLKYGNTMSLVDAT